MTVKLLVEKFLSDPSVMGMGSGKLALRYKSTKEQVLEARDIAKRIIKHSEVADLSNHISELENVIVSKNHDLETGAIQLEGLLLSEPKSHEELYAIFKIDKTKYTIQRYWTGYHNGRYKVTLDVKIIDTIDLESQKEVLLNEIKNHSPKRDLIKVVKNKNQCLLELALFDVHFGKLAHAEESGEDYDLKIAGERYRKAIQNLLGSVDVQKVDRILFPIGNDMFNVDNLTKTTTGGTPQDTDTRFHKMVRYVKDLLIETIDYVSLIAPVDVVVVPGNHDEQAMFLLGEILDAFYAKDKNINIKNGAKLRKYYNYGNTSIMFTHGDKEKMSNLGMIFAAEEPKIWGNSVNRFIQIGHFHHNRTINYLSNQEFQGFQIQILPSLSPNDKWHYGKGYMSKRQAKAFLFDKEKGMIAEYTYNCN